MFVEDNGDGSVLPDRVAGILLFPTTAARACAGAINGFLMFPVTNGNFVVNGG